jgi:ATP adenylyltransferase
MNEKRLWAPWRLNYIAGGGSDAPPPEPTAWLEGADRSCFLCRAAATFDDQASANRQLLVLEGGRHTTTVLNRYPYNNGHLLVSPLRHVAEFGDVTADEHIEALAALARFTHLYRRVIKAEGFNIGLNLGAVAGAGVPGHLHWHLVPRWAGDHNFMPATAATRVISQSLEALWEAVESELRKNAG